MSTPGASTPTAAGLTLLLLAACGGLPDEVPDKPGTIMAEVLPDLLTIGSVGLPWHDAPDGECGTCRDATIDGVALEAFVELTRTLSWPFPAPY